MLEPPANRRIVPSEPMRFIAAIARPKLASIDVRSSNSALLHSLSGIVKDVSILRATACNALNSLAFSSDSLLLRR